MSKSTYKSQGTVVTQAMVVKEHVSFVAITNRIYRTVGLDAVTKTRTGWIDLVWGRENTLRYF